MVKRRVRCTGCNHVWTSKVDNPRCSKCGSRNVEEVNNTILSSPHGEADYAKIFSAFDDGKNLIEVVKQGLCDPDTALELWNKYEELKEKTLEIKEKPKLGERIDELEERVKDFLKVIRDITNYGDWIKENCEHYQDGYCRGKYWNEEQNRVFILESMEENGKWYINPDVRYCALCPMNTVSNIISQEDIKDLREEISSTKENICPNCGQPGIVLLAMCENCGTTIMRRLRA
jgi:hypothetical protein